MNMAFRISAKSSTTKAPPNISRSVPSAARVTMGMSATKSPMPASAEV